MGFTGQEGRPDRCLEAIAQVTFEDHRITVRSYPASKSPALLMYDLVEALLRAAARRKGAGQPAGIARTAGRR
jgi:hypothetical protein